MNGTAHSDEGGLDVADPFDSPEGAYEDEVGVKRDRYGRYLIPDPDTGQERPWTRATTFARTISEGHALQRWAERMVAKGIASRPDLLALVRALPIDNRNDLDAIAVQAKEAAGANTAAHYGTALHAFTEAVDKGEAIATIPEPWDARVRAYTAALEAHKIRVVPNMIERVVIVKQFHVAGTFDRIIERNGDRFVGDLKTGRDLSYAWSEIAVQLALYAHADAIYNFDDGTFEEMPKVRQDKALVMHLPIEGTRCDIYEVNIELGWRAAELCEKVRNWRRYQGLARRISSTQAPDVAPAAARLPINWVDRIAAAETVQDLVDIWLEAKARGEWTTALEQLGLQRRDELKGKVA